MLKNKRRNEIIYEKEKRYITYSVNNNNYSYNNTDSSNDTYSSKKVYQQLR